MKKRIIGILSVLVAILVMSHNAGAVDLDMSVTNIWSGGEPGYAKWYGNDGLSVNSFKCGGGTDYRSTVERLNVYLNSDLAYYIKKGDIVVLELSLTSDNNANMNIDFARELVDSMGNFEVIDIKYSQAGNSSGGVDVYLMASKDRAVEFTLMRSGGGVFLSMNNMNGTECINAGNWTVYRPVGNGAQAIVDAINNSSDAGAINNAKDEIVDAITEQQEKEEQAVDNIENQTPQDISSSGNTENQASSNLIDLIRSFVTALTSVNTGNCDITLDFPSYAGGSRTVNICQNKDKAGNLISVFSSLTLIVFYIPLALKLLTMIYNEIRSFTNG